MSIGNEIHVQQHAADLTTGATDAQLGELRRALATLRSEIETGVPEERRAPALRRVDELEDALAAPEPDVTTAALVLRWFRRNLPKLAGGVISVVVNPIVGTLVSAAGDAAVAEFEQLVAPGK